MKPKNKTTLDEFKDKHYGLKGSKTRDKLDSGYENFKLGALLYEARQGWEEQFKEMANYGDDRLLINDVFEDETFD